MSGRDRDDDDLTGGRPLRFGGMGATDDAYRPGDDDDGYGDPDFGLPGSRGGRRRDPGSASKMSIGKLALIGGGVSLAALLIGGGLLLGGALGVGGFILNLGILGGLGSAGAGSFVAYNKMKESVLNPKSEDEKPVKEQNRNAAWTGVKSALKAAVGVTAVFFVSTLGVPLLGTVAALGLIAVGAKSAYDHYSQSENYKKMTAEQKKEQPDATTPKKFKARMIGMGVGAAGAAVLNLAVPAMHSPLTSRSITQEYNNEGELKWTPMTSNAPNNGVQLASSDSAATGSAVVRSPSASPVIGGA